MAIGTRPAVDSKLQHVVGAGPVDHEGGGWAHAPTVCRCRMVSARGACPEGVRAAESLTGQGVDQRHPHQDAEHTEGHPAAEERGHRAGSGTGTVGCSDTIGTEVTRTRGRRCDS